MMYVRIEAAMRMHIFSPPPMMTSSKNRSWVIDSLGPKGNKLSEFQIMQLTQSGRIVPKLYPDKRHVGTFGFGKF